MPIHNYPLNNTRNHILQNNYHICTPFGVYVFLKGNKTWQWIMCTYTTLIFYNVTASKLKRSCFNIPTLHQLSNGYHVLSCNPASSTRKHYVHSSTISNICSCNRPSCIIQFKHWKTVYSYYKYNRKILTVNKRRSYCVIQFTE